MTPDVPKVFGIGLSKTGTTSLFSALGALGYKSATYRHMNELGLKEWLEGDFSHDYLANYNAVTDLPVGTWFRELDMRYPNSRFILTERPVDSWLASIERQFRETREYRTPGDFAWNVHFAQYGVQTFNKDRFRMVYQEHRARVLKHFEGQKDRLLVMNFFEDASWHELCRFLDKPLPNTYFPNLKPGEG